MSSILPWSLSRVLRKIAEIAPDNAVAGNIATAEVRVPFMMQVLTLSRYWTRLICYSCYRWWEFLKLQLFMTLQQWRVNIIKTIIMMVESSTRNVLKPLLLVNAVILGSMFAEQMAQVKLKSSKDVVKVYQSMGSIAAMKKGSSDRYFQRFCQ